MADAISAPFTGDGWFAGPPAVVRLADAAVDCIVVALTEQGLDHALTDGWRAPTDVAPCGERPLWRVTGALSGSLPTVVPDLAALDRLLGAGGADGLIPLRDRQGPGRVVQAFHLYPQLPWFAGHFPGDPILPGIVQVRLAVDRARLLMGADAQPWALHQLKFKAPIRPDQIVELAVERVPAGNAVVFGFRSSAGEHSSGRLHYAPA